MKKLTARKSFRRLLPVFTAISLLLAGCADSKDGTAAGIDAEAVDELLEGSDSGEDSAESDETPETDDASEPDDASEDSEFSGDDSEAFCLVAEELDQSVDGFGDSTDPADVKAAMEKTQDGFDRALDVAPDEIRDAVQTNADAFKTLGDELAKVEYSLFDLDLSVLQEMETEKFSVAEDDLDLFLLDVCCIGDGPSLDDDPLDDEPLPQGSAKDQLAEGLVNSGLTAAEAECVLDKFDPADPDAFADPAVALAIFEDCDISLERLAELGS